MAAVSGRVPVGTRFWATLRWYHERSTGPGHYPLRLLEHELTATGDGAASMLKATTAAFGRSWWKKRRACFLELLFSLLPASCRAGSAEHLTALPGAPDWLASSNQNQ